MIFAQTAVNTPSTDLFSSVLPLFEPLKEQIISLFDSVLPILIQIGCVSLVLFLGLFLFVQIKKYFAAGAEPDIISDLYEDDGYLHYDGLSFEDEGDLSDYLYGKFHPEIDAEYDEMIREQKRQYEEELFDELQERMRERAAERGPLEIERGSL